MAPSRSGPITPPPTKYVQPEVLKGQQEVLAQQYQYQQQQRYLAQQATQETTPTSPFKQHSHAQLPPTKKDNPYAPVSVLPASVAPPPPPPPPQRQQTQQIQQRNGSVGVDDGSDEEHSECTFEGSESDQEELVVEARGYIVVQEQPQQSLPSRQIVKHVEDEEDDGSSYYDDEEDEEGDDDDEEAYYDDQEELTEDDEELYDDEDEEDEESEFDETPLEDDMFMKLPLRPIGSTISLHSMNPATPHTTYNTYPHRPASQGSAKSHSSPPHPEQGRPPSIASAASGASGGSSYEEYGYNLRPSASTASTRSLLSAALESCGLKRAHSSFAGLKSLKSNTNLQNHHNPISHVHQTSPLGAGVQVQVGNGGKTQFTLGPSPKSTTSSSFSKSLEASRGSLIAPVHGSGVSPSRRSIQGADVAPSVLGAGMKPTFVLGSVHTSGSSLMGQQHQQSNALDSNNGNAKGGSAAPVSGDWSEIDSKPQSSNFNVDPDVLMSRSLYASAVQEQQDMGYPVLNGVADVGFAAGLEHMSESLKQTILSERRMPYNLIRRSAGEDNAVISRKEENWKVFGGDVGYW
ncbi:hypothetical protein HDV05_000530 [Chytridiales sp. JEL 0842]|nr:hypothetical protein HDV05_000530 [Chytridiales sp. JEL 0842]